MVLLLFVVAIIGYLAGYHRAPAASGAASAETTRIASGASAPAGLLSGQLPAGEASPLPGRFLALARGIPYVEVMNLLDVQAYRYSRLSLPGYDRILDLYVIPNSGGNATALACYASNGFSAYLSQCEQIVAKLTPVGQSQYDLTPNTPYARRLGALIEALDRERLRLRSEIRRAAAPAAVGRLATALAGRFATAAASLAALEPPLAAGPAQAALASAILRGRDTYRTLAAAGTAGSLASYDAARRQVDDAEAGVDAGLESFALLGYNHT